MSLALNKEELSDYLHSVFPQIKEDFRIEALAENAITVRLLTAKRHLRPGDTISGPSMFALADMTVYAMVLAMIGPRALAVTTNCSIDFMRKPAGNSDLIAQGKLLKLGRLLAVGDVLMFSPDQEGLGLPVARATLTYSIPPDKA